MKRPAFCAEKTAVRPERAVRRILSANPHTNLVNHQHVVVFASLASESLLTNRAAERLFAAGSRRTGHLTLGSQAKLLRWPQTGEQFRRLQANRGKGSIGPASSSFPAFGVLKLNRTTRELFPKPLLGTKKSSLRRGSTLLTNRNVYRFRALRTVCSAPRYTGGSTVRAVAQLARTP